MKYFVFSDIHSNYEALKALSTLCEVYEDAKPVCLGDITGYGASPNECIEFVRGMGCAAVVGNHDYYVAREEPASRFTMAADSSLRWHIYVVSDENKAWLKSLPEEITEILGNLKIQFIHGSPAGKFEYVMSMIDARRAAIEMVKNGVSVAFIGHTHVPSAWVYRGLMNRVSHGEIDEAPEKAAPALLRDIDDTEREYSDMRITLRDGDVAIVNAGSAGQPRDGDPRGSFVIFDTDDMSVEFVRFEYDIDQAKRKIVRAGLPVILASRLDSGR